MCATGHHWSDGTPACSCGARGLPGDDGAILVEPLRDEPPATFTAEAAGWAATAVIAPPKADPILSDDGWWQWDGSAWVPAADPPGAHAAAPGHVAGPDVGAAPGYAAQPYYAQRPGYAAPATYGPATGYLPPGYLPPAYAERQQGRQDGRDGLAIAALVCSLVPFLLVPQLVAVVFAIIALTRVGRTGKKGTVMASFAIAISVLMFLISVAIAIPVFLSTRQSVDDGHARSALRNAAAAEETYVVQNGTYPDAAQLDAPGEKLPAGISMWLDADGAAGYCLAAGPTGGTRWQLYDSFHGGLQKVRFTSADDAIRTCVSESTDSSGATGSAA